VRNKILADLQATIRACTRCDALVRCRTQPVPGAGEIPADVMFIGIAPGRFGGDRTGTPFSGDRSGNLLREMIAKVSLDRVFITNLVRCNPRDDLGRNRDPDAAEIANCRDHLAAELSIVRPRVIACLGQIAWRELTGRARPFDPIHPQPLAAKDAIIYPMYHPAYVNRGAYSIRRYRRDFRRLADFLESPSANIETL
jgi:uracil-DNA glycosylase family 4